MEVTHTSAESRQREGVTMPTVQEALDTIKAAEARYAEQIAPFQRERHVATEEARSVVSRAEIRAVELVRAGAKITGRPYPNVDRAEFSHFVNGIVYVAVQTHRGDGEWEPASPVIFPLRWLDMRPEEWQAELQALVNAKRAEKAEKEAAQAALLDAKAEMHEREEYARLAAKYGTPPLPWDKE